MHLLNEECSVILFFQVIMKSVIWLQLYKCMSPPQKIYHRDVLAQRYFGERVQANLNHYHICSELRAFIIRVKISKINTLQRARYFCYVPRRVGNRKKLRLRSSHYGGIVAMGPIWKVHKHKTCESYRSFYSSKKRKQQSPPKPGHFLLQLMHVPSHLGIKTKRQTLQTELSVQFNHTAC